MKSLNLVLFGKFIAVTILILGIIHDVATFTPLIKGGLSCLTPSNFKAMIYMSLICGTAFILSGLIIIILLRRIEQYTFLISPILVFGIFLAISGILSIVYMFNNPFAWIAFLLNTTMFAIAIGLKANLNKK